MATWVTSSDCLGWLRCYPKEVLPMREMLMFLGYSDEFEEYIGRMISAEGWGVEGNCR